LTLPTTLSKRKKSKTSIVAQVSGSTVVAGYHPFARSCPTDPKGTRTAFSHPQKRTVRLWIPATSITTIERSRPGKSQAKPS
jgi:hypothetical protein